MQATPIKISPTHPAATATDFGSRDHTTAESATMPPAANSQARAGSEKNAHGRSPPVQISEIAKESAATTARTIRYGSGEAEAVRRRRTSQAVAMMSAGHTR